MRKVWLIGVLLMVLMIIACPSAKREGEATKSNVLYFISINDIGPYWMPMIEGAKDMAKELGYEVVVKASPSNEPQKNEKHLGFVSEAVSKGVAGIALAPMDPDMFDRKAAEVFKAGIPLVTFDADIKTTSNRLSYVGTDNYEAGIILGRKGAEFLKEQGINQGSISRVAVNVTQTTMVSRLEGVKIGFNDVMGNDAGNFTWLEPIADEDQAAISKRGVEAQIVAVPDLVAIFSFGAEGPDTGVMEALRSSGKLNKSIAHFGFDYTPTWLNGVDQGLIVGIVNQDAYRIGQEVIIALDKAIRGESLKTNIPVDVQWILAEDIESYGNR